MKIVTFNLRTLAEEDKEQNFIYRFPFIKEKIGAEKPDIIGMQEMTFNMRDYVINGLTDYYLVGGCRNADRFGEGVCIAFNKNRFTLNDCETFWLSETPDVPGSRYPEDQSIYPRTCVSALLTDNETKVTFRFYVMHTDHEGKIARLRADKQLKEVLASRKGEPFIITGDFNASPTSPEIEVMTNGELVEMEDVTSHIKHSFHNFGRWMTPFENSEWKIDYIFVSKDFKAEDVHTWEDKKDYLFLSDHYPISAIISNK